MSPGAGREGCEGRGSRASRVVSDLLLGVGLAVIAAVCWHSVGEIHYLKTFFPPRFTVAEACLAAVVEVIKVGLIAFPILLAMGLVLLRLRATRPGRGGDGGPARG